MADNLEEKLNKELDELDNLLDSEINNLRESSQHSSLTPPPFSRNDKSSSYTVPKNQNTASAASENFTVKDFLEAGRRSYLKSLKAEALQYFQKASELQPNNLSALFNIGVIYLDREEYELAMRQFEKALEISPDDYKSLCNLAGIYYKLGKLREAYDILNRAISINPNDINSLQNMKLIEKKILHTKNKN